MNTESRQLPLSFRFAGSDYDRKQDDARLTGQILRVYDLMKDSHWRTLAEIETETGDPQASISAQLRHLRKKRFGSHDVNKRSRGDRSLGLFEYQLIVNESKQFSLEEQMMDHKMNCEQAFHSDCEEFQRLRRQWEKENYRDESNK